MFTRLGDASMRRSWRLCGLVLASSVGLGGLVSAPALAAPRPCEQIKNACREAGFREGAQSSGKGLEKDCYQPIVSGERPPLDVALPLPHVRGELLAACRKSESLMVPPAMAPQRPGGLVAVLTYNAAQPLSFKAFDNPSITGVALQIHWADIEPNPEGSPDWSTLDALFRHAEKTRKWVQLLIFPGFFAPSWAYPATDSAVFPIPYGPGKGRQLPLPAPWDATYQANWLKFMKKIADRYGGKSEFRVMAAAGPTSVSVEATLPDTLADLTTWRSLGYTQTKYVAAWTAVLGQLAAYFPNQFVTIAGSAGQDSIVRIDASGTIVARNFHLGTKQMIVDAGQRAIGPLLGLQNSNLDGSAGGDEPNTDYVIGYAGKMLTGFQLRSSVSGGGMGEGTPAHILKTALDNGLRANASGAHVDYIEIYNRDVEDPRLQSALAAGAARFKEH